MLRKLFLFSLIILTPLHSLAALQMPFDHQTGVTGITVIEAVDVSQHPCHQDVTKTSTDEDLSLTQAADCNACTLCMAFGFSPVNLAMMPDHFSMIVSASKQTRFISHDSLGLNKPPIL
jgi:hypothetical protein